MSCGTIKLRRPRVRDLEERFESRVLPLSPSTVARLKQKWQGEMEASGWMIWKWCICGRTACTSKQGWRRRRP